MKTLSLKLPDTLYSDLTSLAEDRGMSRSALVREAIGELFRRDHSPEENSALSLMEGLVGSVDGPADLSSNKDYLDDLGH